jgi:hypothetical protein
MLRRKKGAMSIEAADWCNIVAFGSEMLIR